MPRSIELERKRSKEKRDDKSRVYKVWKEGCNCEKGIRTRKKKNLIPRMWGRKKKKVVELGRSGIPYRGKSTARQHIDRNSERYSERER